MKKELIEKLIKEAKKIANKNFCCSHSNYTVGASLLTKEGNIYHGFNVENDGIASICAERVAFVNALTKEEKDFLGMAVVGKAQKTEKFIKTLPCGYCRQFIAEYANPDFKIYTYDDREQKIYEYTIEELLPESFKFKEVKNGK